MRLPWGYLDRIHKTFLDREFALLGCLSFEYRSTEVPVVLSGTNSCLSVHLLQINDPKDGWPNYSGQIQRRIRDNVRRLQTTSTKYHRDELDLLANDGEILSYYQQWEQNIATETVVLDITAFPKRYFCLILKRLILSNKVRQVIVTYTMAGPSGYATGHLSEDPMSCDNLPGFAAPAPPRGDTLVVAVGFEELNIRGLVQTYRNRKRQTKVLMAFPSSLDVMRRQFRTFREMVAGEIDYVNKDNVEIIAAWDAEYVYRVLLQWSRNSNGLTLAPFGPKPHTLGMTLFAVENDSGMYYSQPKSYNPNYSQGSGDTYGYVVKWEGIPCYMRP